MSTTDLIKELARSHYKKLIQISITEATAWARLMADKQYEQAHKILVGKMDSQELVDDLRAYNNILRQLNREAMEEEAMWLNLFVQIFIILVSEGKEITA